jgi:hypothetical protein
MRTHRLQRSRQGLASAAGLAAVTLSVCLAGCSESTATHQPYKPAKVGPATAAGVKPVTFTAEGARRIGLATSAVANANGSLVVDYTALIYDSAGGSWVYTIPEPLTYVRTPVKVSTVDQHRAFLADGPVVGTPVVTTGAAQLYGEELGISGKH